MAKTGFTLDIKKFEQDLERIKLKINVGIIDGMFESKQLMVGIMRVMMDEVVYNAYSPVMYERSDDLFYSIKAEVDGDTLYIYSDGEDLDKMDNGLPYSYRVLEGDSVYPYDFHPKDGSDASYLHKRNWIEATRSEILENMQLSERFLQIIKNAVQKRI